MGWPHVVRTGGVGAVRTASVAARAVARLRRQAGRLRWRLGAGYMRVTLAAVVIIELLGIVILTQAALMATSGIQRDAARRLAPVVADLLDAGADPRSLSAYLERPISPLTEGVPLAVALPKPPQGFMIVVRPDGTFWYDNRLPTGASATTAGSLPTVGRADVQLAQRARRQDEPLTQRGLVRSAHAVPLVAADGSSQGALLLGSTLLPFTPGLVTLGVAVLLVATVLVALVGTVYGLLTSRPLVRRIEALSVAADAWSRGDLSVAVRDGTDDELGRLGRRLDRMAEQLRGLVEARQALATSRERTRLARELHDSVKQQVFAAGMRLGAARGDAGPAAAPHLAAAEALVAQAQQELSDLIHELRPLAVDGTPLGAAIAALVTHDGWSGGLATTLDIEERFTAPPEIGTAIYRIAQEAVANVARHAKATRVRVALRHEGDDAVLAVEDDGVGFDVQAVRGRGVGLASMAERVEDLGGRLQVTSRPGGGTRLRATIPLGSRTAEAA